MCLLDFNPFSTHYQVPRILFSSTVNLLWPVGDVAETRTILAFHFLFSFFSFSWPYISVLGCRFVYQFSDKIVTYREKIEMVT